ncbi:hypothetical protein [Nocardioides sp. R-C-SC26]|nr:hypothetical protein [Nocardioides sp. R-C-SC26]
MTSFLILLIGLSLWAVAASISSAVRDGRGATPPASHRPDAFAPPIHRR